MVFSNNGSSNACSSFTVLTGLEFLPESSNLAINSSVKSSDLQQVLQNDTSLIIK